MFFNLLNVEGAETMQVGRVASDKEPLLTSQELFVGLLPTFTALNRH